MTIDRGRTGIGSFRAGIVMGRAGSDRDRAVILIDRVRSGIVMDRAGIDRG